MFKRYYFNTRYILLFLFLSFKSQSQDSAALLAGQYFKEALSLSQKDNGKLWGIPVYGPMLLVDRKSGRAFANVPDSASTFIKEGEVFTGQVPKNFGSNTAKRWGGKVWTVILWPLPNNKNDRASLMMHELFHQVQLKTNMPSYSPACDHLDRYEGRLLLQLELEALRKAVNDYPHLKREDISNAIALRKYRYSKYPNADSLEHALEFNEGLATYTGFALAGLTDAEQKKVINNQLEQFYTNKTFTRSLGYITGYLYGYLLYKKTPGWVAALVEQRDKKGSLDFNDFRRYASFEDLAGKLYHLKPSTNYASLMASLESSGLYRYKEILLAEQERENKRLELDAGNRKKFVEGPVLELPNDQLSFNFDPNEVQVLEGLGPIYPSFAGTAAWGQLQVDKGGVLIQDWMKVFVPLPAGFDPGQRTIKTPDWQLELKEGWLIMPGKRKGDFVVVKQ